MAFKPNERLNAAFRAYISGPRVMTADDLADLDREQKHFGTELDAHHNLDAAEDVYDARRRRKDAGLLW